MASPPPWGARSKSPISSIHYCWPASILTLLPIVCIPLPRHFTIPTSQIRSPNHGESPVVSRSRNAKRALARSNIKGNLPELERDEKGKTYFALIGTGSSRGG